MCEREQNLHFFSIIFFSWTRCRVPEVEFVGRSVDPGTDCTAYNNAAEISRYGWRAKLMLSAPVSLIVVVIYLAEPPPPVPVPVPRTEGWATLQYSATTIYRHEGLLKGIDTRSAVSVSPGDFASSWVFRLFRQFFVVVENIMFYEESRRPFVWWGLQRYHE